MSAPSTSLRDRVGYGDVFMLLYPFSFQVKYSAYRDRPVEERKRRFVEDLREGHSVIVSLVRLPVLRRKVSKFCKMRVQFIRFSC